MPGPTITIFKWLHCLFLCIASAFENLEAVNAFTVPAAMKGRQCFVDEICLFTGFASLQHAGKESEVDGKALLDSWKHLKASVNSFKGLLLV